MLHLLFHGIEDKLYRANQLPMNTWNEMQLKMEECFLRIDYELFLCTKVFNLKQGNKLVEEFMDEFHELSI